MASIAKRENYNRKAIEIAFDTKLSESKVTAQVLPIILIRISVRLYFSLKTEENKNLQTESKVRSPPNAEKRLLFCEKGFVDVVRGVSVQQFFGKRLVRLEG